MPRFERGRPLKTTVPQVTVDAGLPVGTHRFRLTLVNDSGNQSNPALIDVIIGPARIGPRPPIGPIPVPTRPGPVIGVPIPTRPVGITPTATPAPTDTASFRGVIRSGHVDVIPIKARKKASPKQSTGTAKKTTGKKTIAKKGATKEMAATKSTATIATTTQRAAKNGTVKKSSVKKGTAKKGTAKKGVAKKSTSTPSTTKASTGNKSAAKKGTAKKGTT